MLKNSKFLFLLAAGSSKQDSGETATSMPDRDMEVKTRIKLSDTQMGGSTNSLLTDNSDVQSIKSAASERSIQQPCQTAEDVSIIICLLFMNRTNKDMINVWAIVSDSLSRPVEPLFQRNLMRALGMGIWDNQSPGNHE